MPRHLRLAVTERVDAQGAVVEPLRLEELDDAVDFIKRHDVQAVAVCVLYSFLNDTHERAIGAFILTQLGLAATHPSPPRPDVRRALAWRLAARGRLHSAAWTRCRVVEASGLDGDATPLVTTMAAR